MTAGRPILLGVVVALLAAMAGCCGGRAAQHTAHIEHVVLIWLKPPVAKDQVERLIAGANGLKVITAVDGLAAGTAIASPRPIVDSSWDVGLVVRFADRAAMDAYLVDPRHVAFVEEHIKPNAAKVQVFDIAVP